MASKFIPTTIDAQVTTTLANYRKTLIDNFFNGIPFYNFLRMGGRLRRVAGGGSVVEHLLTGKNSTVGPYNGYETFDTTPQENTNLAEYQWQQAYATITISGRDEMINSGEQQLIDLLAVKIQQAELSLRDDVGKAVMQSVPTYAQLSPLSTIVNTGTLAGIAGATETYWQSTVTSSGAFASQGLTDMRTLFNTISASGSSDHPDAGFTTQTVFEAYESILEPKERITNTALADAGIRNLEFKGIPLTYDQYCDSGILYFLNSNYLSLVIHSERDFTTTPFVKPTNQDAKTAAILLMFAQTTNNRRRQGKLTSIS